MLVRLLLVLLLALGAPAPAMAGDCAAPAMPHHTMPDMPSEAPSKAMPAHLCVGCVPLGDWLRAPVAAPAPAPALPPVATIARLDLIAAGPPALPPPRRG